MNKMKEGIIRWILLFIVSLGFSLSMILGFIFNCEGTEQLPSYYASPFVFKRTSLASSMEFFYSLSGIIYNTLVWAICLGLIDLIILRLIKTMKEKQVFERVYFILKLGPFLVALFFILLSLLELGKGFDSNSNYWSFNLEQDAKNWGATCNQKWVIFFEEIPEN